MTINLDALWSYAGVSMREDEGGWADPNRMRMLRDHGFGYVAPLLGDGATEQNREFMDVIVAEARRNGTAVVGWFTPRPTLGIPISVTVAMAADAKQRYGLAGVRYQTEAEFEFSNPSMGGDPGDRFSAMAVLGDEHRKQLGTTPGAVYARVGLNLADAWWAKAWQYGFRCFVENYGPSEGGTHPGWSAITAPGSAQPPLVGGWWYRTKLGSRIYLGRINDDGRAVTVEGQGVFPIGSPAGPRFIQQFGDPKWGAIVGFFPTSWIKPVEPTYIGATGVRPSGSTLAGEIVTFQKNIAKYGGGTKGFSVFVGPEMTADHFAHISPTVLTGTALLP